MISIHAPTRGATMGMLGVYAQLERISIHAPTRGATRLIELHHNPLYDFNPRTHTGCDIAINGRLHNLSVFQSTHPHGVRRLLPALAI